jgi:hypothetical protein
MEPLIRGKLGQIIKNKKKRKVKGQDLQGLHKTLAIWLQVSHDRSHWPHLFTIASLHLSISSLFSPSIQMSLWQLAILQGGPNYNNIDVFISSPSLHATIRQGVNYGSYCRPP